MGIVCSTPKPSHLSAGTLTLIENPREEYDVGEVDADDLLEEEMSSNYDVNVVEVENIDEMSSMLEGVEILGDVSQEVDF